jgi:hypothetical protein
MPAVFRLQGLMGGGIVTGEGAATRSGNSQRPEVALLTI